MATTLAGALSLPGVDWQSVLAQMSREAQMPFADAALATMETALVTDVQTSAAQWWHRWMPWALGALGLAWTPAILRQWYHRTPPLTGWESAWTTAWQHAWASGDQVVRPTSPVPETPHTVSTDRDALGRLPEGWTIVPPSEASEPSPPSPSPEMRREPSERNEPSRRDVPASSGPKPPQEPPPRAPIPLLPAQQRREAQWIAEQTAALHMREWADGMQAEVRALVVSAVQNRWTADQLTAALSERWRLSGVNLRRIAVTELNAAYTGGLLLALPEYTTVYIAPIGDDRVCTECKRLLEGFYFTVLHQAPAHPTKRERETCLWPSKSNFGRTDRRGWDPCTPLHPFCRHVPVSVTR